MLNCLVRPEFPDINVLDIVTAPYTDIKGERKIGLFLIVYMEDKDPNDFNNRNVTGLKLTSKDLYANVYRTLVTTKDVPKLTNNSYIYANKLSTLLASNCRFVSKLPTYLCEEVLNKLQLYLNQVNEQTQSGLILELNNIIKELKGGE